MHAASSGALVGVGFGCAWGIAGSTALPPPSRAWALGFSIGISVLLAGALAMRPAPPHSGAFDGQVYGVTVALEAVGIVLAAWLLGHLSHPQFILPAIGFVVGLHFVGLWKATNLPLFLWTAGAMCILCVVAAFLPGSIQNGGTDVRRVVTGLGCALVLWAAGATTLFRDYGA